MTNGPDLLELGREHMDIAHEFDSRGRRPRPAEHLRRHRHPPRRGAGTAGLPGTRHAGRGGRTWRHPVHRLLLRLPDRQRRPGGHPVRRRPEDPPLHAAYRHLAGTRTRGGRSRRNRRHRCGGRHVGGRRAIRLRDAARCRGSPDRCRRGRRHAQPSPPRLAGSRHGAVGSGIRSERSDVHIPDGPRHPSHHRARIGNVAEWRAAVRAGDDRWHRAGSWRRLAARTVAEAPVARGADRDGAGADLWPGAVRAGAGAAHQRLPGGVSGRCDDRRNRVSRAARRS